MFFSKVEQKFVQRKAINNNHQTSCNIDGYVEMFREPSEDALVSHFYEVLKDKGKVDNGSFKFFPTDLLMMESKLIGASGGFRSDLLIYSSLHCFEKVQEYFGSYDKNARYENVALHESSSKNDFVICTYSNLNASGLCVYDDLDGDGKWILKTPIYRDVRYIDTEYDYYYGIKIK